MPPATEYRLALTPLATGISQILQVQPKAAVVNNVVRFTGLAGLTPGQYSLTVIAVNIPPPTHECVVAGGTLESCSGKGASLPLQLTVSAAPKFTVGQRVEAWKCGTPDECAAFGDGVAVREQPSFSSPILQAYPPGQRGTVKAGPVSNEGFTWWVVDYDGTGADGNSTETNLVACTAADCTPTQPTCGYSDWTCTTVDSACVNGQLTRTETCKRSVLTEPVGCVPPTNPELTKETKTTVSCTPPTPVTGTIAITSCTFKLSSKSPDGSTSGWVAQFKRGTTLITNVGTADKSSPYERTVSLAPGSYTFLIQWTKGTTSVTQPLGTKSCEK